ncbi:extracellular matrix regulator RemB [Robertmurraya sp. P23]|uniref:extracellular matrix regulator RemB n=1 Tax=Robertmurraya sp. P23 TaxID=3436931 RepID=UPI003D984F5A
MYVHIGEETLVRAIDIVAIISKESVVSSSQMNEFLMHDRAEVVDLSKGGYKSIVITKDKIYYSPLSSGTLKKRSYKLAAQY